MNFVMNRAPGAGSIALMNLCDFNTSPQLLQQRESNPRPRDPLTNVCLGGEVQDNIDRLLLEDVTHEVWLTDVPL